LDKFVRPFFVPELFSTSELWTDLNVPFMFRVSILSPSATEILSASARREGVNR
jgi:hypothetical protein